MSYLTRDFFERDVLTYSSGAEIRTPEVYATRWAEPMDSGGSESWRGQQVQTESKFKFKIRYFKDVKAQHRVIFLGSRYEIVSIGPDEVKRSQMILECKALG